MEGDYDNYNCNMGSCSPGWAGTSFAAPRWAGFMAMTNQQALEAGTAPSGGLGFINPAVYSIGNGSSYGTDLNDISSGNNDTANQPVWFSAVAGYDLVTGWGSPTGQDLIDALAGPQVPGFWLQASTGLLTVNPGASNSTTITVNDAGGFTGSVNLAVTSGLPTGVTAAWGANPTTGSSVLTLTATSNAATATGMLTITGTSGDITVTTNLALTVHGPSFALWASPPSLSLNQGASGTSTITVVPQYGFTWSVQLAVTSTLPTGVTASWGTNPTSGTSVLTLTAGSSAPYSSSTITITGTSGNLTAATTVAVTVQAPTFRLTSVGNLNIGLGSSGGATIFVDPEYGFTGSVALSVSGLPSGVTALWNPNPTSTGSSILTLTASNSAAIGTATVTITGTWGSATAVTTFALGVYAPSFLLYAGNLSIGQGSNGTTYINISPQYGFTGNVALAASGLPGGVTASFAPNPTTGSSVLTLAASAAASLGQYNVIITGTSGQFSASATLVLTVYPQSFTLWSYGGMNIGQGGNGTTSVFVSPQYGFSGAVAFSVSGLPSGVTASFSPNPTATASSGLTFSASNSASLGQYNVIVIGTSGSLSATTTVTVGIYVPSFTLGFGTLTIGQGASATTSISVNPLYGFAGNVTLSASELPSGVTASWNPNPTALGNSSLTLTASGNSSLGQYNILITGTSGAQTASSWVDLSIYPQGFTLSDSPNSLVMNEGSSGTATVYIAPQYGFNGPVTLSASGLPSGVTATFAPNPTATGSSVLTLAAAGNAAAGTAIVTITGASGAPYANTTLSLTVNAPNFTLADSPSELNLLQGASEKSAITVIPQNGFSGNVSLAVTGLPCGVTGSWNTNPTAGSSVLTLAAAGAAAIGTFSAIISGTSGALTATLPLAVNVKSAPPPTTTTLSVTSAGVPATSISSGSTITLTAAVRAASTPLTTGLVKFCDATAVFCEDIHIIGTAQLTNAGTAVLKFIPGIGSHSYKAVFEGASGDASSSSSPSALAVTGKYASTTTIAASGAAGNYTLTAAVKSPGPLSPTGIVSFLDISNAGTVLGAATLNGGQTGLNWLNSSSPATGVNPSSIATADFNGDGIPDMAIANSNGNSLTILLGNGDGTFTPVSETPQTGSTPVFVAVADFNGDGKADLAVANLNSNSLTILLGNGDGTFTPSLMSPATGNGPESVTVSDFNRDGIPDLAVANYSGNSVTVLLGNGDGTFNATAMSPQTGNNPLSITSADFNGDGISDLAVTNYYGNSVTVLLGNGDGTFSATAVSPQTGTFPQSIAVADLNGDGKPDLAVANWWSNTVTVLLGNGDGTFNTSAVSPQTGDGPTSIAVGDFNQDGNADLAVPSLYGGELTILLCNGNGTFTAASVSPQMASYPYAMAVADFNGDGFPDLAVANYSSDTATVLLSMAQTATAADTGISPVGTGTHQVEASYPGDNSHNSSISATTGLTAQQATPRVTVTPSSLSITTAQQLQVSVTVGGFTGKPTPTGTITLTSSAYTSAAIALSNGSAVIVVPPNALAAGSDTLTASYAGDGNYPSSIGAASVTVTATPQAVLLAPAPGGPLPGTSVTFTWTSALGAVNYELFLGSTTPGAYNVFYSGDLTGTSVSVNGLPFNGETIYARLYTRFSGKLTFFDYTYTAAALTPATITAPAPGSSFTAASETFTWTAVPGATNYELYLGNTGPGSSNVYNSGNVTAATLAVSGLPKNGRRSMRGSTRG
jgi:hypothetical protein